MIFIKVKVIYSGTQICNGKYIVLNHPFVKTKEISSREWPAEEK